MVNDGYLDILGGTVHLAAGMTGNGKLGVMSRLEATSEITTGRLEISGEFHSAADVHATQTVIQSPSLVHDAGTRSLGEMTVYPWAGYQLSGMGRPGGHNPGRLLKHRTERRNGNN